MARILSQRLRVRAMVSATETFQPLDLNWYGPVLRGVHLAF